MRGYRGSGVRGCGLVWGEEREGPKFQMGSGDGQKGCVQLGCARCPAKDPRQAVMQAERVESQGASLDVGKARAAERWMYQVGVVRQAPVKGGINHEDTP